MRMRKSATPRQPPDARHALVDDLGAAADRVLGGPGSLVEVAVVERDLDDLVALVARARARNAASCSSPLRAMRSAIAFGYGRRPPSSPRSTAASSCVRCAAGEVVREVGRREPKACRQPRVASPGVSVASRLALTRGAYSRRCPAPFGPSGGGAEFVSPASHDASGDLPSLHGSRRVPPHVPRDLGRNGSGMGALAHDDREDLRTRHRVVAPRSSRLARRHRPRARRRAGRHRLRGRGDAPRERSCCSRPISPRDGRGRPPPRRGARAHERRAPRHRRRADRARGRLGRRRALPIRVHADARSRGRARRDAPGAAPWRAARARGLARGRAEPVDLDRRSPARRAWAHAAPRAGRAGHLRARERRSLACDPRGGGLPRAPHRGRALRFDYRDVDDYVRRAQDTGGLFAKVWREAPEDEQARTERRNRGGVRSVRHRARLRSSRASRSSRLRADLVAAVLPLPVTRRGPEVDAAARWRGGRSRPARRR